MSKRSINNAHFKSIRVACLLVLGILAIAPLRAIAGDWQPDRILLSGSDERVWVVAASRAEGDKVPEARFWFSTDNADKKVAAAPKPSPNLQPVSGNPTFAAADKSALRVLYGDLALWRYETKSFPATDALFVIQSERPPLAFAGDAAQNVSWFLVDADTLARPVTTSQADDEATVEAASQPAPTTLSAEKPKHLALLRLERGFWTRIDVPEFATGFDGYRMAIRHERVHVFWQNAAGDTISYSAFSNDTWSPPAVAIRDRKVERYWVGSSLKGPILIVGLPAESANTLHLSIAFENNKGWVLSKPIGTGGTPLTVSRDAVSATIACNQLAVAMIEDSAIQFAWGDISTAPTIRKTALSMAIPSTDATNQGWRNTVQTMVLLLLVTIVLATRREQMQTPAAIPKGYILATVWRRAMASLIDVSPAAILILLLNWDFLGPLLQAVGSSDVPVLQSPEVIARQDKIWMLFVAMYGGWCFVLEGLGHTTLGKRILNCRVLSADGTAPTARQILIRNAIRILIVGLGTSGVLVTFMLLAMFTVNRQRLGDILANTIVVQPTPPPLKLDESSPFDDGDSRDGRF